MIKKLQIKLIAVAMISLFAVLSVIISLINILNYQSIVGMADNTLSILVKNDGKFPIREFGQSFDFRKSERKMSPELPYESRFFSVLADENGEIIYSDMDNIAAVDTSSAQVLVEECIRKSSNVGFIDNYRYIKEKVNNNTLIVFLDCTRSLETFHTFLFMSCGISFLGLLAVFVLIVVLSSRIIQPVSQSYEKQKRFVTDAGHEIKTPITIIDADAEVLSLEIGENEWLQDIRRQTQRLSTLTKDLIYLSKMEETQNIGQMIDFPLSDIVADTAQHFESLAKMQGKSVLSDIAPMISFCGDEKAIRQLFRFYLITRLNIHQTTALSRWH